MLIDVAFINIENGSKIAEVFLNLGVSQIFTFGKSDNKFDGPFKNFSDFMRFFTIEMIKKLF